MMVEGKLSGYIYLEKVVQNHRGVEKQVGNQYILLRKDSGLVQKAVLLYLLGGLEVAQEPPALVSGPGTATFYLYDPGQDI